MKKIAEFAEEDSRGFIGGKRACLLEELFGLSRERRKVRLDLGVCPLPDRSKMHVSAGQGRTVTVAAQRASVP